MTRDAGYWLRRTQPEIEGTDGLKFQRQYLGEPVTLSEDEKVADALWAAYYDGVDRLEAEFAATHLPPPGVMPDAAGQWMRTCPDDYRVLAGRIGERARELQRALAANRIDADASRRSRDRVHDARYGRRG